MLKANQPLLSAHHSESWIDKQQTPAIEIGSGICPKGSRSQLIKFRHVFMLKFERIFCCHHVDQGDLASILDDGDCTGDQALAVLI